MFGRIKKAFIISVGEANKRRFKKSLPKLLAAIPANHSNLQVVSMSGKKYFDDQLLSLLSFYYNIGIPQSWTIYNDGTYTQEELKVFDKIKGVAVKNIVVEKEFKTVAERFPTFKKNLIFKNSSISEPTLFVDSDVLFYQKFKSELQPFINHNAYLVDEGEGYFDDNLQSDISKENPLNLGFLLLNSKPDWSLVFDYLKDRIASNKLSYWSDQTAFHILAQKEGFTPLPKEKFVTGGRDAFTIKNSVDYSTIALRHFVGPVRHKMWQISWRKILGTNK